MSTNDPAGQQYIVVVNDEEQYSIWPEGREIPLGWRAEGTSGSREACLDHIEKVWTDMRPRSLREALAAGLPEIAAPAADDEAGDPLVQRLATGSHPVVVASVGDRQAEAIERFRHHGARPRERALHRHVGRHRTEPAFRSRAWIARAAISRGGRQPRARRRPESRRRGRALRVGSLAELAGTGRLVPVVVYRGLRPRTPHTVARSPLRRLARSVARFATLARIAHRRNAR